MLYLLLLYAGITFTCLLAGILFYEWLMPRENNADMSGKPFIFYTITGLIFLTGITQWIILLTPLTGFVALFIVLAVLIAGIIARKKVSPHLIRVWHSMKNQWLPILICLCCMIAMVVTINAGPIKMDDSESYHIQMVKWLREYGTVPGLANLHLRYGFNSSWFAAIGLLAPPTSSINSYLVLNGLISCWFCQYLLNKIQVTIDDKDNRMRFNSIAGIFLVIVAGLLAWSMVRGNATTMNYDFITTICVLVLFMELIPAGKFRFSGEWIIWPCFLFTVRIINFPVLLMTAFVLIACLRNRMIRQSLGYLALAILLIAPFIARNVLLSGYAFFPMYQVDIFPVDWKADRQMTISIVDYIKYFNRVNFMFKPLEETRLFTFPGWITEWFRYLIFWEKLVMVAGLAGLATGMVLFKKLSRMALLFLAILILQLISWFFTAPDPRFVFGPLLCGLPLLMFVLPPLNFEKYGKLLVASALFILSAAVFTYTVNRIYAEGKNNLVQPSPLPKPDVDLVTIDGIQMHIPHKVNGNWNRRCYDTPLPCLYRVHPGLRARGKTIKEGFYIDKTGTYTFDEGAWY